MYSSTPPSSPTDPDNTARLRGQVLAFIFVRVIFNTGVRMVYPFIPVFGRAFGVELRDITNALSIRSAAGMLGPFLASNADSRGRKVGMVLGQVLFLVGVAAVLLFPTFPAFVLALSLMLLGNLVFIPSMQAFLGDRVPYSRRGLVLALTELSWSLSFILLVPLAGLVLARWSWTTVFLLLGGLGILGLVWILASVPHTPPADGRSGLMKNIGAVLESRAGRFALLYAMMFSAANEVINVVFGAWLEGAFEVRVAALGISAIVIGAAELGGEVLVGGLTDRLGKVRSATWGLALNSLAAIGLALVGQNLALALIGLAFFYLTFEFSLVSSIPLMTEVLPGTRATFMASYIASMALGRSLGAFIAPFPFALGARLAWLPGSETSTGVLINGVTTVLLNLVALWALHTLMRRLRARGWQE